jgi:large subunit ribosomal protein L22
METTTERKPTRKEKIAQGLEKPEGSKKARRAAQRKAEKKQRITATLRNMPGSQRKARLVIDMVRGRAVEDALAILKLDTHAAATPIRKLIISAIANFNDRFEESPYEESDLYVKTIKADSSFVLKRIQPAPQGRAHRIRKRYSQIFVELAPIAELEEDGDQE